MEYTIIITPTARKMLANIDKGPRDAIGRRIEDLKTEPSRRGKSLVGELHRLRSLTAARRYRIIYQVEEQIVTVHVEAMGIRRDGSREDIYALTEKLLRVGLVRRDREGE